MFHNKKLLYLAASGLVAWLAYGWGWLDGNGVGKRLRASKSTHTPDFVPPHWGSSSSIHDAEQPA